MITKEAFYDKYVDEKIAVHCDTEEKAIEFLGLASDFGYKWISDENYKNKTRFEYYEKDTCYYIYGGMYCEIQYYESREYKIVEYTLQEQESTKYEQLAKILGVEIGEEFRIKFSNGDESGAFCKIEKDNIYDDSKGQFLESNVSVKTLMSCGIIKSPWKPKVGDVYYYIDSVSVEGWCELKYSNDNTDKRILSRSKEVYRTEEEVKEAVKKLGWVVEY